MRRTTITHYALRIHHSLCFVSLLAEKILSNTKSMGPRKDQSYELPTRDRRQRF